MTSAKTVLLAGFLCSSVFGQYIPNTTLNPQIGRVYQITASTAMVDGTCNISADGNTGAVCQTDFEYGTAPRFIQAAPGLPTIPASGRTSAKLIGLPPDTLIFVRAVVRDGDIPFYGPMQSFRTAKTDTLTGNIYAIQWDDDCVKDKVCVNVFWNVTGSPLTSVFVTEAKRNYTPQPEDYILIGTSDSCLSCRVPVERGKSYTFVVVGSRTAGTPSMPDGPALAQYTFTPR